MVRATTGGVLKSYRYNLMNSFIRDNKARETVLTQRVFNSYAEDPAAAAKTFRLRKARMMTDSQLGICQDTYYKHSTAFSCLLTIDELIDTSNGKGTAMTTLSSTTLEMLNDPKGDARVQLTKVLDNLSDEIVQNLNQTYGDDFIFAGADGRNVPFTVQEENGVKKLYYRGVSVDAQEPQLMKDGENPIPPLSDGRYVLASATTVEKLSFEPGVVTGEADGEEYYVKQGATFVATIPPGQEAEYTKVEANGGDLWYKTSDLTSKADYDAQCDSAIKKADGSLEEIEIDGKTYYVVDDDKAAITQEDYDAAKLEADKLTYLMNEKRFVDIGLGFKEDENGKLIESSAFNEALNGLSFIGYGLDEDGDPKNIYSIVQRLKEIAESVPEAGTWSDEVYEEFRGLVLKLEDASSEFKTAFTNMDAGTQKLSTNINLLEENVYNLKEQYSNIEDVDMADAITSFLWAEYCYNAALKVGNSVLSQSLMDYLT